MAVTEHLTALLVAVLVDGQGPCRVTQRLVARSEFAEAGEGVGMAVTEHFTSNSVRSVEEFDSFARVPTTLERAGQPDAGGRHLQTCGRQLIWLRNRRQPIETRQHHADELSSAGHTTDPFDQWLGSDVDIPIEK